MADIIDQANDHAELMLAQQLKNAQKFNTPSRTICMDCDDDIPVERQKLGAVLRCIDCQQEYDVKKKRTRS